jgi:cytochrome b561
MRASEPPERYTSLAIALHWLIALVVIGQIALGWWMQEIPKEPVGPRVNAFNLHKSIGMTVLLLMVVRLAWRSSHRPPPLPPMPAWQAMAARSNHWLLYLCLFLQPLTGYLGSAVSGYPVRYFGLILPAWAAKNIALKDFLSIVHFTTSWVLVAAIALHVAAALKHQFADRDQLIWRMWPRRRASPLAPPRSLRTEDQA